MKLLQINPVIRTNTSTGRIMKEIGEMASSHGWESYVAYSGGRDGKENASLVVKAAGEHNIPVPVGSKLSVFLHGLETRLFDRHGLGSRLATKRFIRKVKEIDPDIIHIHNVHGYFLNYKLFFKYLAESKKPVVWTVHDCWLFTGHCYHYSSIGCMRWKDGCHDCPQKKEFPSSYFIDRSRKNYIQKKEAFTSLKNIQIVTVSEWMRNEMHNSFLRSCNYMVIHNGIDTDVFAPCKEKDIIDEYHLTNKKILLGITSVWTKEKGIDDFIQLSKRLNHDEQIVLVGQMNESLKMSLPKSIITIARTNNQRELAQLYSSSTALINPTWQDNYPTVNMEAMSCGTPVITYKTGGSIEAISPETGFAVEQGDIDGLLSCIKEVETKGKDEYSRQCRLRALDCFRKEDRYMDYIHLYESLLSKRSK